MTQPIILASGSPRRREILSQVSIPHTVMVSNADETVTGTPAEQVEELALRKANAILPQAPTDSIIIAADTIVAINQQILNKPQDTAQAFAMLQTLQGNWHEVYTGVAILNGTTTKVFHSKARVKFRPLSDEEITAYIGTGEPMDKAGAYGIQEKGAALVASIEGDFYTVMGLPIFKICEVLLEMGYRYYT